jgi:hypothetical protein
MLLMKPAPCVCSAQWPESLLMRTAIRDDYFPPMRVPETGTVVTSCKKSAGPAGGLIAFMMQAVYNRVMCTAIFKQQGRR